MKISYVADISQEHGEISDLTPLLESGYFTEIVLVVREDQLMQTVPPGVVEVVCNESETAIRRVAIGLQQVSSGHAIFSGGPIIVNVERAITEIDISKIAYAQVERTTRADDAVLPDTSPGESSFFIDVEKYAVLRGFNYTKNFNDAIEDFVLRCELMGWHVSPDQPSHILTSEVLTNFFNVNSNQGRTSTTQNVNLIANLPAWRERPNLAQPLVSVSISTFNRAAYLKEAIESVLAQSFQDFEIVVVDDGSDDNTAEIVAEFHDVRIVYTKIENSGIAHARNIATSLSRGYFTAVHDSDDLMLPDRLELGLKALRNDVKATYGAWVNFDNTSSDMVMHVTKEDFDLNIVANNGQTPGHPTWLVPTSILKDLKYDSRLSSAVDHNVAVRTSMAGIKWAHVGKAVMLRRIHDGQISETDSGQQKVGAVLTRQFAVDGMSFDQEMSSAAVAKERKWPIISEKANLHHFFDRYLPDNLAERIVEVSGPIASKLGILTAFQTPVGIAAELDRSGSVRTERAWVHNPSWADLGRLASAGYGYTLRSATDQTSTDSTVEAWIRGRLRSAVRSVKNGVWAFVNSDGAELPPDGSSLGYYYSLESKTEGWIYGKRVQASQEAAFFFASVEASDAYLVANSEVPDDELLSMLGVAIND